MSYGKDSMEMRDVHGSPVEAPEAAADGEAAREAELRRQMYERIAQGNALAEVEEHARRKWMGR